MATLRLLPLFTAAGAFIENGSNPLADAAAEYFRKSVRVDMPGVSSIALLVWAGSACAGP